MDCTAETTARVLVEHIFLRFNIPTKMTSDNGRNFISETIKEIAKLLGIKRIFTAPYNPQANGSIERRHRNLAEYLKCFVEKQGQDWHNLLQFAIFTYNNTVHSTTNYSPNELAFGFSIKIPTNVLENKVPIYNYENYRNELRLRLYEAHQLAKEHISERKIKNKEQHDKNIKPLQLKINDLVLLKKEV